MLERTATSLEPCGLQRVLPSTRHSLKSRRDLHTAFWQHGATEYELFDACQNLLRAPFLELSSLPIRRKMGSRPEALTASSNFLEFLYPNGMSGFLRRFLSNGPEHRERLIPNLNPVISRIPYSSGRSGSGEAVLDEFVAKKGEASREGARGFSGKETEHEGPRQANPEVMRVMLDSCDDVSFDKIWDMYCRLEGRHKDSFRAEVTRHLAKSDRPLEAWRVSELFSTFSPAEWSDDLVAAGIKALLTLRRFEDAVFVAKEALGRSSMGRGLDRLVAYGLESVSPETFLQVWASFTSVTSHAKVMMNIIEPKEVCSVPSLGQRFDRLYTFIQEARTRDHNQSVDSWKDSLDLLGRIILDKSLALLQPHDATRILEHVADRKYYEEFVSLCMHNGQTSLAKASYRKYRQMTASPPGLPILRTMLDVFYPEDAAGMEQVREDWYRNSPKMDMRAYQKFIAFYSRRGDVRGATQAWEEYKKAYAGYKYPPEKDVGALTSLMNCHAVRGETEKAEKILEMIEGMREGQFGKVQGNVLLNTHRVAGDYDAAVALFLKMYESGRVDHHSFGLMMGFAGSRGDLMTTIDFYNMARDISLEPDLSMIDALVEAYCQNDRFAEAERICLQTTKRRGLEGDYAVLWNTVLHHNARRRDLTAVNSLIQTMSEHNVPYNNDTYTQLLTALVFCRQSHHALHLLKAAKRDHVFEPTDDHYLLLMTAFLKSREPHMALYVDQMMTDARRPDSASRTSKVIEALGKWQELPAPLQRNRDGYYFLQQAFRAFKRSTGRDKIKYLEDHKTASTQYHRIVFILVQMREYATIPQILELWKSHFPDKSSNKSMPTKLLNDMLLVDFCEGKHKRVLRTWEAILERAVLAAKVRGNHTGEGIEGQISPNRRNLLNDPLKTMQRYYLQQDDAPGLVNVVARVQGLGFVLDNKNWNYHVQALAKLRQWKDAFRVCEEVLMPRWGGWYRVRMKENVKNQLPLELRRIGSAPLYYRPISYTLLVLAKEYTNLERMAPWSHEAAKLFDKLKNDYPLVVNAIVTLQGSGSQLEKRIFRGVVDESKLELEDELVPVTADDLTLEPDQGRGAPSARDIEASLETWGTTEEVWTRWPGQDQTTSSASLGEADQAPQDQFDSALTGDWTEPHHDRGRASAKKTGANQISQDQFESAFAGVWTEPHHGQNEACVNDTGVDSASKDGVEIAIANDPRYNLDNDRNEISLGNSQMDLGFSGKIESVTVPDLTTGPDQSQIASNAAVDPAPSDESDWVDEGSWTPAPNLGQDQVIPSEARNPNDPVDHDNLRDLSDAESSGAESAIAPGHSNIEVSPSTGKSSVESLDYEGIWKAFDAHPIEDAAKRTHASEAPLSKGKSSDHLPDYEDAWKAFEDERLEDTKMAHVSDACSSKGETSDNLVDHEDAWEAFEARFQEADRTRAPNYSRKKSSSRRAEETGDPVGYADIWKSFDADETADDSFWSRSPDSSDKRSSLRRGEYSWKSQPRRKFQDNSSRGSS